MKKIISLILSLLMMISTCSLTVIAETDSADIRFDFSVDAENVTVAGDSGASATWNNGQLVLSVSAETDLSCKKIGVALPNVDLGDGGYYMHVKVNYNSNVAIGTHYVNASGKDYDSSLEPWTGWKINSYDISTLTGSQNLNWLAMFAEGTGTAEVNIAWIVLSKNSTIVENEEDIRFDFISDVEGTKAGSTTTASVAAENGICVVTTKETALSNNNIRLELPEINLGDGGYYMYVKSEYKFPEGAELSRTYVQDVSDTSLSHGEYFYAWGEGYYIRKIDISSLTGNKTLKLSYQTKRKDNPVTGVGVVNIDWIIISKDPNLKQNTSFIASLNVGANNIALNQDNELTEATVSTTVYTALGAGTTNALPNGFVATLADGASNVTYKTTITDKTTYKIVDICANGFLNGVAFQKCYRVKVEQEVTVASDVRLDFINSVEDATGVDATENASNKISTVLTNENGEVVLTGTHNANKASEKIQINLPYVNLADGGYYMYAKIKYSVPEGETNRKWSAINYATTKQGETRSDYIQINENGSKLQEWTDYKILKIDTRALMGMSKAHLQFTLRQTTAAGDHKVYIDWVVFSQDEKLDESTSVLSALKVGTDDIVLAQNGDISEVSIDENVYTALISGATNALPSSFTATLADGVSDVKYNTTVSETEDYKIVDITASGVKSGSTIFRTYRIVVTAKKNLIPDIRFDFTNGLEGADNAGAISKTIEAVEGNAVITAENTTGAQNNVAINLPYADLGEGGYYMYAKVKYDLPDTATNRWSAVRYDGRSSNSENFSNFVDIYTTNADRSWTGYKIIKIDTSALTGSNQVQLRFVTRQTEATGTVKLYVDWVVFSQKDVEPSTENLTLDSKISFDETTSTWTGVVNGELEHTTNTKTLTYYFAGYEADGTLAQVDLFDMYFDDFKTKTLTLTDPDIAYAKIFLWNDEMTPYCEANVYPAVE